MAHLKQVAPGTFRVEHDGRVETVYAVGTPDDRWVFWNGRTFRFADHSKPAHPRHKTSVAAGGPQELTAPMPATIVKVLVQVGARVRKGDTLVVAEAMKMELPVRALADGVVTAISCREGELAEAGQTLVTLE